MGRDERIKLSKDVINKGDEAMESFGDGTASTKGFDVSERIKNMQDKRIRKTLKSIHRREHGASFLHALS